MMDVVRVWAIPAVLGVALGAAIAAFAPGTVLKIAFVVIASTISVKLLFGGDSWRLGTELPGRAGMMVYGFLVGLASSLMGISGGSLSNMILTLYGTPIHRAVATSAGLGVPITHRGRARLHAGRAAAPGRDAAALDRLRVVHRGRRDGADLELRRPLWGAARPCACRAAAWRSASGFS